MRSQRYKVSPFLPHMDFLRIVEEVKESTIKNNSKAKGLGIFSVNTYVRIFSTEENAQSCKMLIICLVSSGGKKIMPGYFQSYKAFGIFLHCWESS